VNDVWPRLAGLAFTVFVAVLVWRYVRARR
jgi:hypothetical protein